MQCPRCYSTQTFKNGFRQATQCYKCKQCGRQFLESYQPWCYSKDVKPSSGPGKKVVEKSN